MAHTWSISCDALCPLGWTFQPLLCPTSLLCRCFNLLLQRFETLALSVNWQLIAPSRRQPSQLPTIDTLRHPDLTRYMSQTASGLFTNKGIRRPRIAGPTHAILPTSSPNCANSAARSRPPHSTAPPLACIVYTSPCITHLNLIAQCKHLLTHEEDTSHSCRSRAS